MSDPNHTDKKDQAIDRCVQSLLRMVIQETWNSRGDDRLSEALLLFTVRVSNTWLSIRTLRDCSPDQRVFLVDAAALLRVMLDACFQAEYLISDPSSAKAKANDYLDFEHVERHQSAEKIFRHDNAFTRGLRQSPKRPCGEERMDVEYRRVKNRYPANNKGKTRDKWYQGDLRQLAKSLGREVEYDTILAAFHGCIHSSAFALKFGPPISPEFVTHWASTIAARVAKLAVDYHKIALSEDDSKLLAELVKPYAWLNAAQPTTWP